MICFFVRGVRIELHFLFVAMLTFACLFDPTGITLLGMIASTMHELGHFVALWLTRQKPSKLSFELAGITVVKSGYQLSLCKECLVLASGILVNLACFLAFSHTFPYFAMAHLVVGAFNLLPFPMLDGGKLLSLGLAWRYPPKVAEWLEFIIQIVFLLLLSTFCIDSVRQGNPNWLFIGTVSYLFYLVFCNE